MERREALKTMLLAIGGLSVPRPIRAAGGLGGVGVPRARSGGCWVTPEEIEGPFYFDPALIRSDIREGKPGVLLTLEMNVIDEFCNPRPGVLVDVWHCDKDGCYSGYNQITCNAIGETFLRGTQITDGAGVVQFTTIYPGWYPGRATHIHFKVRTAAQTYKTSQFAFPDAVNEIVYASPLYVAHGQNPRSNEDDGVFGSPEPEYLLIEVMGDPDNGYAGTFTIGLSGDTSSDVSVSTPASALQLAAHPAPFRDRVTVVATLPATGFTHLAIYDAAGRRVRTLANETRPAGAFEASWDGRDDTGGIVPAGVYFASLDLLGRRKSIRLVRIQ